MSQPSLPAFPPRGSGLKNRLETAPAATWSAPETLNQDWTWQPGRVLLGQWGTRLYGIDDDRHFIVIAGSRTGKTATVLAPNLRLFPGPVLVIDPKGELVRDTASDREKFGPVYVLDPFAVSGRPTSRHNPFEELRRSPPHNVSADAAQLAEALIIESGNDTHWSDSARNLLKGLILYLVDTDPDATLGTLRTLLNETDQVLGAAFAAMTDSPAFDGAMANIGAAFLSMMDTEEKGKKVVVIGHSREMGSILSTARQQTAPLDDVSKVVNGKSDFSLSDFAKQNATIYLVLPGMRLGTHYRWLRLVLMQALAAMEMNPVPRGRLPAWFVLEEFAALGHIRAIETAAGYMAGFGVRIFAVLQDLSQLKNHYKNSWETFLGNAGCIQAFGNVDATTTEYLSRLIGQTTIQEKQQQDHVGAEQKAKGNLGISTNLRLVPLLAPDEIALHFGRDTHRALVHVPGEKPVYLNRLPFGARDDGYQTKPPP